MTTHHCLAAQLLRRQTTSRYSAGRLQRPVKWTEKTVQPLGATSPYEAVPPNGNISVGYDGERYYWNFADAGTVIDRDVPGLREKFGESLVRAEEIDYRGKRLVIQLWQFDGYDQNGVQRTTRGT